MAVPKLRFRADDGGEFPEWKNARLSEIVQISIGEFVIKNKQDPNYPYPVFNGGISNTGYYKEYNNEGDNILISARGANAGFVNRISGKYWAGNSCYSLKVGNENSSYVFLFYRLKFHQKTFLNGQQTANIPAISKKQIEDMVLNLPSMPEQKKIADFLSAIDEKIDLTKKQLSALNQYKKGLMQQLFV